MKYTNILLTMNFVFLLALSVFIIIQNKEKKQAYVLNQRLFDEFKGTQVLESKLNQMRKEHGQVLDSLVSLIQTPETPQLVQAYQERHNSFELREQELSEKYTADIWKQINKGVTEYGESHGYDFILGASGNGSLMFAQAEKDITDEVVSYLNDRYEGN